MKLILTLVAVVLGPLVLVLGKLAITVGVAKIADCHDVTAAGVPDCTLFGTQVGEFVYSGVFTGYQLGFALLWAAGCLAVLFIIGILIAIGRALKWL